MNGIAPITISHFLLIYLLLLIVLTVMKRCRISQSRLLFIASLRMTVQLIIAGFVLISLAVERAWCRWFCPLGIFNGLMGKLSLFKIRRNEAACIHCGACSRASLRVRSSRSLASRTS